MEDLRRVHEIDKLSFSMPWSERSFTFELTENHNSIVWVAEVQPEDKPPLVVAVIVVWVILDEAHVATIATHPDYRGLGIARRILARVLLVAQQRGARLAYLEVRRSNLAAKNCISSLVLMWLARVRGIIKIIMKMRY
jgi:[ribosomal protein S18]-alanine N-acetyltransferase